MKPSRRSHLRKRPKDSDHATSTVNEYLPVLDESEKPNTNALSPRRRYRLYTQVLCGFVHTSFFAGHIVLLYVAIFGLERYIEVPLGTPSKVAETALTVLLQTVGTIYTLVMLFTMQQLSIRRQLRGRTTLTNTHDTIAAWSGLGSSLLTMWRQMRVPAAVSSTFLIVTYLGGIAMLHITTPALFSLQTFNLSSPVEVNSQGMLNYTTIALGNSNCEVPLLSYWGDTSPGSWTDASDALNSVIPIRNLVKHTQFVGLANGTVYDVLDNNSGNSLAQVNATYFNVSCGLFPEGISASVLDSQAVHIASSSEFYSFNHSLRPLYPGEVNVAKWKLPFVTPLFFLSTTNTFIDSQGQFPGILAVNYSLPGVNGTTSPVQVRQVQTLACSLHLNHITVTVDANTKLIQDKVPRKQTSTFTMLSTPEFFNAPSCNNNDQLVQFMSQSINHASLSPWSQLYTSWCGSSCNGAWMGVADQYIMESLSVVPYYLANDPLILNCSLHELENAMSNMFATAFWADANWDNSFNMTIANMSGSSVARNQAVRESRVSVVLVPYQVSQLSSSMPPLIVGLVISAILLAIAAPFFLSFERSHASVNDLGILQVLWLLKNDVMANVDEPTIDNLRKAGMAEYDWESKEVIQSK